MATTRFYHPQGFTWTPQVREILDKYEGSLYGWTSGGGIVLFDALPAEEAAKLLALLPPGQGEDCQNLSPSFARFVELGKTYGLWFHGYRVEPERPDGSFASCSASVSAKELLKKRD